MEKGFLSLGERITLIQSSLSHISNYFLSLFKIPISIVSKIEKLQRDFLWSKAREDKKDHLINWDIVCKLKEFGGMRFGKTTLRNHALLRKWLWRFLRKVPPFGIRLFQLFIRHILIDETPTFWSDNHCT